MELLICEDYHFYPNGIYQTTNTRHSYLNTNVQDLQAISEAIRIFGTKKQINQALEEYMDKTGLMLDECYKFEPEPKDSRWYNKEDNKNISDRLKRYKEMYNKKEALIINLI
jgi:hypothetical protein